MRDSKQRPPCSEDVVPLLKEREGEATQSLRGCFLLKPENLVALGVIKGLGANQNLLDSANKPITYAKITTALTSQGEIAKGAQEAYFTLKANAPFAVMVAGVKVAPGETKMFQVVLDAQGKASLPIYPAVAGVKGTADFMIDIPQLLNN